MEEWIPHIKELGCNAIYFSPLFESDTHGYNTRDFQKLDCRLGTNEDFKQVVDKLHAEGIKVVLDGVFNHVGRGFFGFSGISSIKGTPILFLLFALAWPHFVPKIAPLQ